MLRLSRLHAVLTRRQRRAPATGLRGMTLLEIMIVLAILALVMALLIGPRIFKSFNESKAEVARSTVRKLANEAYPQWAMKPSNSGKCPSYTDLAEYMNSKDEKDPFGNPYVIKCGGDLPAGASGIAVMSKGEDGKEGTGDDLKSWE